jgi:3-oxoadipate enol-lactonase
MPYLEEAGLSLHYVLAGPADAPLLVLSNSLGSDLSMWDPQMAALDRRFRVLRYDARGHGRSSVPAGPYTLPQLATDVLRLLDHLRVDRAHFCGLSVGGLVGMWVAAHAKGRVDRLALCNTAARIGTLESWGARMDAARSRSLPGIAEAVLERWFTPGFREREPAAVARARAMLEGTPLEGYLGCCAAIRDADAGGDLAAISAPTLVISGSNDAATTPAQGRALAEAIAGARSVELAAAHLSNIEAAAAFTAALTDFLAD